MKIVSKELISNNNIIKSNLTEHEININIDDIIKIDCTTLKFTIEGINIVRSPNWVTRYIHI